MNNEFPINKFFTALNYTMNKFCPMFCIAFVLFYYLGFEHIAPYIVIGLVVFSQQYHYKIGYSVAICKERGLLKDIEK